MSGELSALPPMGSGGAWSHLPPGDREPSSALPPMGGGGAWSHLPLGDRTRNASPTTQPATPSTASPQAPLSQVSLSSFRTPHLAVTVQEDYQELKEPKADESVRDLRDRKFARAIMVKAIPFIENVDKALAKGELTAAHKHFESLENTVSVLTQDADKYGGFSEVARLKSELERLRIGLGAPAARTQKISTTPPVPPSVTVLPAPPRVTVKLPHKNPAAQINTFVTPPSRRSRSPVRRRSLSPRRPTTDQSRRPHSPARAPRPRDREHERDTAPHQPAARPAEEARAPRSRTPPPKELRPAAPPRRNLTPPPMPVPKQLKSEPEPKVPDHRGEDRKDPKSGKRRGQSPSHKAKREKPTNPSDSPVDQNPGGDSPGHQNVGAHPLDPSQSDFGGFAATPSTAADFMLPPAATPPLPVAVPGSVTPQPSGLPPGSFPDFSATPAARPRFCAMCGEPVVPGANFCRKCGHELRSIS